MIQSSLESWLKKDNIKSEIIYFNIKWVDNFLPEYDAIIKKNKLINNYNNDYTIIYKELNDKLIINGIIKKNKKKFKLGIENKFSNYELLKSHLIYCINIKDYNLSILTSMHMIKLDLIQFINDLIFITIEKNLIHESILTLIWLKLALDKEINLKLEKYIIEWILGYVYLISFEKHIYNDKIKKDLKDFINIKDLKYLVNILDYENQKKNIIYQNLNNNLYYKFNKNINIKPISIELENLNLSDFYLDCINLDNYKIFSKYNNNIIESEFNDFFKEKEDNKSNNLLKKFKMNKDKVRLYILEKYY